MRMRRRLTDIETVLFGSPVGFPALGSVASYYFFLREPPKHAHALMLPIELINYALYLFNFLGQLNFPLIFGILQNYYFIEE